MNMREEILPIDYVEPVDYAKAGSTLWEDANELGRQLRHEPWSNVKTDITVDWIKKQLNLSQYTQDSAVDLTDITIPDTSPVTYYGGSTSYSSAITMGDITDWQIYAQNGAFLPPAYGESRMVLQVLNNGWTIDWVRSHS